MPKTALQSYLVEPSERQPFSNFNLSAVLLECGSLKYGRACVRNVSPLVRSHLRQRKALDEAQAQQAIKKAFSEAEAWGELQSWEGLALEV